MEKRTEFQQYLEKARKNKGLSLRQVEQETGISNAYLSQLETGKIKQPSPTILHKLSQLYDVPYTTLMKLVGYPVPDPLSLEESSPLHSRIGPTSPEEEEELIEYLAFLRSKRKKAK